MILVTGATGFLGHNLVSHLIACGYSVRALVRPSSNLAYLGDLGVDLAFGDVEDSASVNKAMAGCQYVVHAAALFRFWADPKAFERTNVEGTAYVLEAARRHGVERLVHISTVAVVGNPPPDAVIDETTSCKPVDPYQRSKLDGENLVKMFHQAARLPVIILRPGAFYGPWGHYAFNRLFFEDPLKGLRIQVHRGQRITFPVFVPDVARAIATALKAGQPGEIYNISGESIAHSEANAVISQLAGISPRRLNVSANAMATLARAWTRVAEMSGTSREPYYPLNLANYVFNDWRVSSAKARADLGFTPTPFAEGALQTLEWYWNTGLFRRPKVVPLNGKPQPASEG